VKQPKKRPRRWAAAAFPAALALALAFVSSVSCGGAADATVAVTGVTVAPKDIYVVVGASQTNALTATVAPSNASDKTVAWRSSDDTIATVSAAGVVAGVAVGSATITATTRDGGKTGACAATVGRGEIFMAVVPSKLSLAMGDTQTLTVIVMPSDAYDGTVAWQSSDDAVAKVSAAGAVTGAAVGTATIAAFIRGGSMMDTCSVTVTAAPVAGAGGDVYVVGGQDADGGPGIPTL